MRNCKQRKREIETPVTSSFWAANRIMMVF